MISLAAQAREEKRPAKKARRSGRGCAFVAKFKRKNLIRASLLEAENSCQVPQSSYCRHRESFLLATSATMLLRGPRRTQGARGREGDEVPGNIRFLRIACSGRFDAEPSRILSISCSPASTSLPRSLRDDRFASLNMLLASVAEILSKGGGRSPKRETSLRDRSNGSHWPATLHSLGESAFTRCVARLHIDIETLDIEIFRSSYLGISIFRT